MSVFGGLGQIPQVPDQADACSASTTRRAEHDARTRRIVGTPLAFVVKFKSSRSQDQKKANNSNGRDIN